MKNTITITILLFAFSFANAQKVKLKKGIATVDGTEYVKVVKDDGDKTITNLNGDELIFVQSLRDTSPSAIGYTYTKVIFIGMDKTIEVRESIKKIIKILYKNKAINENGTLNEEKVELLVQKYGNEISPQIRN